MFTPEEVEKFEDDAPKYGNRFNKGICLNVYNEMVEARTYIRLTKRALKSMPEMHELAIP
jgi:nucleolar protein 58